MKRIGNIFCKVLDVYNGIMAVRDGTRFKRGEREVRPLLYDEEKVKENHSLWHQIDVEKAEKFVKDIIQSLINKTWTHGKPRYIKRFCKNKSSKGKWRELYVPQFKDHIVAHMVMQPLEGVFLRGMHPHCCGSVPHRGISHIVRTVSWWLKKDRACKYFVKLDIRHFFDSITKDNLKSILRKKIKDPNVLWILDQIIDSAPVACPIGYYTSPWFANLYLESFDWFVEQQLYKLRRGKRIKYVRHYLRYMDDMLLIGTSKSDLYKSVRAIKKYLKENLGLEIKNCWEIKKIGIHETVDGKWKLKKDTYWIDIGGYRFCKDASMLGNGIYLSTKRLIKKVHKKGYMTLHEAQEINAKLAWAKQCKSSTFFKKDIYPYINIKESRRVISCGIKAKMAKSQNQKN